MSIHVKQDSWTDSEKATAEQMWRDDYSSQQIADQLGRSKNSVVSLARRERKRFPQRHPSPGSYSKPEALRKRFMWTIELKAKASQMWRDGAPISKIAEEVGCAATTFRDMTYDNRERFPPRKRAGTVIRLRVSPDVPLETLMDNARKVHVFDSEPFRCEGIVPVRLVDIGNGQCRFPVSNDSGPDMLMCGGHISQHHPTYCDHHAAISRGRGTEAERRALRGISQ